jgi:geranylgeranyl pyrophosphate synthase
MSTSLSLSEFLEQVDTKVQEAIASAPMHESQRALLAETAQVLRQPSLGRPLNDPLAITFLIARQACSRPNLQAEHVGVFCQLYRLAANLFDDVEDEELDRTPHARAGSAVAINDALALLCLALQALTRAVELESDGERRLEYLRLFNRVSLLAVGGQHLDLLGAAGARTPEEVLAMQHAKASSLCLLAECGALLGGHNARDRAAYQSIGEELGLIVQIRDDLRDVFGKTLSPDLAVGKVTYPVACFLETATKMDAERFEALRAGLPATTRDVRALLHASGAVHRCAGTIEGSRRHIHQEVASLVNPGPEERTLLSVVDALAESIYAPAPVQATAHLWSPRGDWHDLVRAEAARFAERTQRWNFPEPPPLRPWHLPQWMFDAAKQIIHYPDIDGLPEEIVPFYAHLLGTDDVGFVRRVLTVQAPAVLAHEMFHCWRHRNGRLTQDHWHEEWVANQLAVAHVRQHDPRAWACSLELADRVVPRWSRLVDERAERVLQTCGTYDPDAKGYAMSLESMAVVTLEMVRRLSRTDAGFDVLVCELLAPPSDSTCRGAASVAA